MTLRLFLLALAAAALSGAPLQAATAPPARRPFCAPAPALAACTAARLCTPIEWKGGYEPLDKVLRTVARRAFVPMSVVLARPLPNIELPQGRVAPAALLNAIVRTHRQYRWRSDRGVVVFEGRRLAGDQQNFLNWRLPSFTIGPQPGDDMLVLHQVISQSPQPPGTGIALAGPSVPIAGRPARETVADATGAGILLRLLRAAPTFYSQIIFPSPPPLTHKQALEAIGDWIWAPLTRAPIPPPPPPCGPFKIPPNAGPHWVPPPCPKDD